MRAARLALAALLVVPAAPRAALARVVRVVVDRRSDVGGGRAFGAAGAYERLAGRVFFAFDPRNPHDRPIVDLARAPRNARGEVEAWAEFVLLRPKDPRRASGVTLLDVVNRGGITTGVFHLGADRDQPPDSAASYGDALLLRRGLTVVALGWQWDVPPGGDPLGAGPLHFHPPVVTGPPRVTGLVRSDVTVDAPARTIPLGHRVGASQAVGYPVLDPDDSTATLTERDGPLAERRTIPRAEWRFAREEAGRPVRDSTSVYLEEGFRPGHVYEVVYRAADPVVTGTGLAAVRDLMSWLKYDSATLAPTRWGVAYGVSQTGRFLRHFLYQGFNTDERGRRAFDGVFAHTAGAGRGSFNHRFAQPSRDAQPYSTFFYPTDLFPFTSPEEADPATGARGGLRTPVSLQNAPKVFYVDGGYEYWGRAASLTHTTADGTRDVGFLPSERRYVMSSAQHSGPASPSGAPPAAAARLAGGSAEGDTAGAPAWRGNPLDQRLLLRGLLVALVDWVRDGRTPPPSTYPTLAAGTLVPASAVRFPAIPGVRLARAPYTPVRLDMGPGWPAGVVDREPPRTGAPYAVLVAQVDSLGNDLGGVRAAELGAPLATYFPWQLRAPGLAGSDRLASFQGTFVPLPRTEAQRAARGDPRPSLERLYGSRSAYLARVDSAARALVARRFMLDEDVARARARLAAAWDWLAAR